MEHIIKQIKKGAKHTRLSASEKAEMRSALVRHMRLNPVNSSVRTSRNVPSLFNINNFRNKKGISILAIGSLLMGGTVSFAAENTVPGDKLFAVKVYVNEAVRGAVSVTPKAKAEWEVKLVERRLEEVEKLAIAPNVLPEVQLVAERNLERYAERVKNRIDKLDEDEDDEEALQTALSLSEVFSAHEQVLLGLNANTAVTAIATTTLVANVPTANDVSIKDALKKVQGARGDAEKKHKELEKKYSKEKDEKDSKVSTETLQQGQTKTKPPKNNAENRDSKQNDARKEEIRSTVSTKTTSTNKVSEQQKEPKEEKENSREKTRDRDSKEDDND
ncbi:MAG: hypothetical protein WAV98_02185 [Minisyncoccia bacterium]